MCSPPPVSGQHILHGCAASALRGDLDGGSDADCGIFSGLPISQLQRAIYSPPCLDGCRKCALSHFFSCIPIQTVYIESPPGDGQGGRSFTFRVPAQVGQSPPRRAGPAGEPDPEFNDGEGRQDEESARASLLFDITMSARPERATPPGESMVRTTRAAALPRRCRESGDSHTTTHRQRDPRDSPARTGQTSETLLGASPTAAYHAAKGAGRQRKEK